MVYKTLTTCLRHGKVAKNGHNAKLWNRCKEIPTKFLFFSGY